jgi:hypothetical protein
LLWGLGSANNFRVRVDIVELRDVLQLNGTISVDVQFVISLSDNSLAGLIQHSTKSTDEFIKIDLSISVAVEVLKYLRGFFF